MAIPDGTVSFKIVIILCVCCSRRDDEMVGWAAVRGEGVGR